MSETLACRGCAGSNLEEFLDLGLSPLANNYLEAGDEGAREEPRFPLGTVFCRDCYLVQLTFTVDPAILFSHYLYFSSFSPAFLAHSEKLAADLTERFGLGPESFVVEVASNDGYLLQFFQDKGLEVLGVEPAENIARIAAEKGIPTLNRFFDPETAARLVEDHGKADMVIGLNVLAHVPDINPFIRSARETLEDDGVVVFEAPWLVPFLDHCEFDTVYHEHVYYYSLVALEKLFARNGLELFDAQPQDVHGGSIRIFAQKPGVRPVEPELGALLEEERAAGLTETAVYHRFRGRVEELKRHLVETVRNLKAAGKRLVTYGASAKGNTLLNYFDLGGEVFDYAVDRSTYKQGHLTPGKHLPIHAPERLLTDQPDYAVLLTWNFAAEIIEQQREYLERGGTFIIPIPELREVTA